MTKQKKVNLALQGGGSHGAFTWGVLDKFLEDNRLAFEGLSGTSAGGMNAMALAQGLIKGGNTEARKTLKNFWKGMSNKAKQIGFGPSFLDKLKGNHGLEFCFPLQMMQFLTKDLTPKEFNPFGINVLKDFIKEEFDFDCINKNNDIKVFLSATNINKSHIKIFEKGELTIETLLATACLPTLFHPVKINHDYYWDGGFIGNPALFPLTNSCQSPDIIVIQLTPHHRDLPTNRAEIHWRMTELGLINALMREMRVINFITSLIDKGSLKDPNVTRKYLHIVENEAVFHPLHHSSALNSDWEFLMHLFEEGQKTAHQWLEENFEFIGKKTTAHLEEYIE